VNKKTAILVLTGILLAAFLVVPLLSASRQGLTGLIIENRYDLTPDSNFFGKPEDTRPVTIDTQYENTLQLKGYEKIGESGTLELWLYERYFDLAVHDTVSGYTWYSVYPKYAQMGYSGTSKFFLESGVIIEYYNLDNILVEDSKSYLSGPKFNVDVTYDTDSIPEGVRAHLNFEDLAIQFDVEVWIEASQLVVRLPMDSLEESHIEKPMLNIDGTTTIKRTSYRLKAVYLFPYFGANTYEINGYSLIPDGSGALIRYTNQISSTAYTKRIYGSDEGITSNTASAGKYYLRDELTSTMPVFGVNHGYRQAAFLAVVTEGDANAEIHSYPYGYNAWFLNTTFIKFIVRERYTIQTSSSSADSFQLINTDPYPGDYQIEYHFLAGEQAGYSGMAECLKDLLGMDRESPETGSPVGLTFLGIDYKGGLFGKNYVPMTTYDDVVAIVSDLLAAGVNDIETVYLGWNRGGYYDSTPIRPAAENRLGGAKDFAAMSSYLAEHGVGMAFVDDPLISFSAGVGSGVVKKITLSTFSTRAVVSSLFANTYYLSPAEIAEAILKYQSRFEALGIDTLALTTVGSTLFSYRDSGANHYRAEVKTTIVAEMTELAQSYSLGLTQPHSYLWNLVDAYYQAPVESNKYAYVTDSIPFVQMVLAGSAELYSGYVNYVSDYDLFALRLVEYGVKPAFLLTQEPTTDLRYTNSQFIYTSEYRLWKDVIVELGQTVAGALDAVAGAEIRSHRYVALGLAETVYENGVTIYVNYNGDSVAAAPGIDVPARAYRVVMPE